MFTLPKELRERIVTTPWIKHLNLYVCKEWYNFIYDNLPGADLEQYIYDRDYFAVKYIRLNFKYKFLEMNNVKAAVEVDDTEILNMTIKELSDFNHKDDSHIGCIRIPHAHIIEQLHLIRDVIIRNNYQSLKYFLGLFYDWRNFLLRSYNIRVKKEFTGDPKVLNRILKVEVGHDYLATLDIDFLLQTLSDQYCEFKRIFDIEEYFGIVEDDEHELADKGRLIKYAYFECIRQGYYHIIRQIKIINVQSKSQSYEKLLYPLTLSGCRKAKYLQRYTDYDENLTYQLLCL